MDFIHGNLRDFTWQPEEWPAILPPCWTRLLTDLKGKKQWKERSYGNLSAFILIKWVITAIHTWKTIWSSCCYCAALCTQTMTSLNYFLQDFYQGHNTHAEVESCLVMVSPLQDSELHCVHPIKWELRKFGTAASTNAQAEARWCEWAAPVEPPQNSCYHCICRHHVM